MKKRIKLVRSVHGISRKQKANLISLKLNKIGDIVEFEDSNELIGRVKKIQHLVIVENV